MDGQPTRAARWWIPGEWRRWRAFLANPVLPPRADLSLGETLRAVPPLLVLDILLMIVVLGAIGIAGALGLKMPDHLLDNFEITPLLIAAIVIGAPVAEELIFRGWVSGRPGHVLGVLALVGGAAGLLAGGGGTVSAVSVLAGIVLAALAAFLLRKRDAMGWFARHFRWFFYLSALLFAAIHLSNFAVAGPSAALMLPLVLPQFVLGLFLAYLRVQRGLWSSMLMHALHNALFVGLMVLGTTGSAT